MGWRILPARREAGSLYLDHDTRIDIAREAHRMTTMVGNVFL